MTPSFARTLNSLGLLAISAVLMTAFADQILYSDLPCPLCLLQRVGFVLVGFGLSLNVIYGPRPQHYAIMIISAIYGGAVALRQLALHIVPGSGSYGDPILGMHYYTWSAIVFFAIILGTSIMLLFDDQYATGPTANQKFGGQKLAKVSFFLIVFLTAANALSTFLECGPGVCADDPSSYRLLHSQDTAS
jgi:disulfide bond formation protein DsbB